VVLPVLRVSRELKEKKVATEIVGKKVSRVLEVMVVVLESVDLVVVVKLALRDPKVSKGPRETRVRPVLVLAVLQVPWEAREKRVLLESLVPREMLEPLALRVFLDSLVPKETAAKMVKWDVKAFVALKETKACKVKQETSDLTDQSDLVEKSVNVEARVNQVQVVWRASKVQLVSLDKLVPTDPVATQGLMVPSELMVPVEPKETRVTVVSQGRPAHLARAVSLVIVVP